MEINGFYPLYDTARAAAQAEEGDGFSHIGLIHKGKTYYMPGMYRGAKAGEIKLYHGTYGKYDPDMPQIEANLEGKDPDMPQIEANLEGKEFYNDTIKRLIEEGYIWIEGGKLMLFDDENEHEIPINLKQSDAKVLNETGDLSHEKILEYAIPKRSAIESFFQDFEMESEEKKEERSPRRPLGQMTQAQSESPTRQASISINRAMRGGVVDRRCGGMHYRAGGYNMYGGLIDRRKEEFPDQEPDLAINVGSPEEFRALVERDGVDLPSIVRLIDMGRAQGLNIPTFFEQILTRSLGLEQRPRVYQWASNNPSLAYTLYRMDEIINGESDYVEQLYDSDDEP